MNLEKAIAQLQAKILRLRRVEGLLKKQDFQGVYENGTPDIKARIHYLIDSGNESAIKDLLELFALSKDYEAWPIKPLRERARSLGVYYYCKYEKVDLIAEIRKHEQRFRDSSKVNDPSRPVGGLGYRPPN